MSCQVEDLGKNMRKLTIETSAEEFEQALERVYQKNKKKINVQGFRKGKAPRIIVEKIYGAEVFYEDAANDIIPGAYEKAAEESGLEIVSRPNIDVTQIGKGQQFIFTAEVAVKPEVTLGQYKEIEVVKQDISVSEEELQEELNRVREQNSRTITVDNRPIQEGDIAVIDFKGFIDGVLFDGGTSENYSLTIGSHSFIDTFEEQLIGKNLGEQVEVHVTFPEEYHSKELAGKAAVFEVNIKEIKVKELPELDDDFAQDVSEFDTLEEYKNSVKNSLTERKEKEAKEKKENEVIEKIIENASMDIPEAMVETQKQQMAETFSQRVKNQGLTMEQYFQYTGMNANKLMESFAPQALKRIQTRLVLEEIAKTENIEVTPEEIEKEISELAASYQMEVEKVKELLGEKEKESMKMDVAVQKAIDLVAESAKEVEAIKEA